MILRVLPNERAASEPESIYSTLRGATPASETATPSQPEAGPNTSATSGTGIIIAGECEIEVDVDGSEFSELHLEKVQVPAGIQCDLVIRLPQGSLLDQRPVNRKAALRESLAM